MDSAAGGFSKKLAEEHFVEVGGLAGDFRPSEDFLSAAAASGAHLLALDGVAHEFVDAVGEVAGEAVGVERLEGAVGHLLEVDEVAGFAVDDDFLDAADGGGDDSRAASHSFEVDDAEGFVDGGADKDAGVGVEFDFGAVV